jgi:hypothetical protein
MRNYLKINTTADDNLIQHILIPASTIYMENSTGLTLASREFVQSLDSFPFYPYSKEPYGTLYGIGALSLYFGYGPIQPTPFPPFGLNTGERLPFQIDLLASPCGARQSHQVRESARRGICDVALLSSRSHK